jgi:hypothetical protein
MLKYINTKIFKIIFFYNLAFGLFFCTMVYCSQNTAPQSIVIPEVFRSRFSKIIQAINLKKIPETSTLRLAPLINEQLISAPDKITRKNVSIGYGVFTNKDWYGGNGIWNWHKVIKNPSPPTELPEDAKASLLQHIPANIKNEPNLIQEYLNENFENYKKSKSEIVSGELRINLCVAPTSTLAYEYLIAQECISSLPTEAVISKFTESNHIDNLGMIAFSNPLMFVRDNIAVIIDARGELASEAMPLAKKIDALIQKQPSLTAQQIQSHKPVISMSSKVDNDKKVDFKVSTPQGQEIADVKTYVDGQIASNNDGKVLIQGKKGKVKVKVVAVTSELIANVQEVEVDVP